MFRMLMMIIREYYCLSVIYEDDVGRVQLASD